MKVIGAADMQQHRRHDVGVDQHIFQDGLNHLEETASMSVCFMQSLKVLANFQHSLRLLTGLLG